MPLPLHTYAAGGTGLVVGTIVCFSNESQPYKHDDWVFAAVSILTSNNASDCKLWIMAFRVRALSYTVIEPKAKCEVLIVV